MLLCSCAVPASVCFVFVTVCVVVVCGPQTGCLDVVENFQSPQQSACPSTTPALKHTQDKLIPPELGFICTPPARAPQRIHSFPPSLHLHGSRLSLTCSSVFVRPLLLCDRSRTLLALAQPSICFWADYKRLHFSNCPHPLLAANVFIQLTECRFSPRPC